MNLSHFSCPPILNVKKTKFVYEPSKSYCSDGAMQTEVLAYIRSVKPDVIVLAGAWTRYLTDEFIAEIDDRAANRSTAERVISNQLPVTLRTLASDFDVVVIKSWPTMPEDPIARVVKLLNIYKKDIGISRADFAETSAPIGRAIDSLHNLRVRAVDPLLSLCSDMTCFSEKDGIPLYSDRYHLAPLGAMLLKCDLLKALKTNVECLNSTQSTK